MLRSVRGFYTAYDRDYTYLGVRGFLRSGDYNSRILLMVNGHRLNDKVYDSAQIGTEFPLDLNLIDHIEIVRGPKFLAVRDERVFRGHQRNHSPTEFPSSTGDLWKLVFFSGADGQGYCQLSRERFVSAFIGEHVSQRRAGTAFLSSICILQPRTMALPKTWTEIGTIMRSLTFNGETFACRACSPTARR